MAQQEKSSKAKESLAEMVYREVRTAIVLGELRPGQSFNEADLATRYKVSTSPLREALTRLHQDGMIRSIPRRGYMVTQLTLDDFHDLIQLRMVLEAAAAELSATRMTDRDIERLKALSLQAAQAERDQDARAFMAANQLFHELIAERSGNPRLHKALKNNLDEVQRLLFAGIGEANPEKMGFEDHQPIIEALARRSAADAREAVLRHIRLSRDRIIRRLVSSTDAVAVDLINFH